MTEVEREALEEVRQEIAKAGRVVDQIKAGRDAQGVEISALRARVRDLETQAARLELYPGQARGGSANPEILAAWGKWARTGSKEIQASLSVGSDPDGGVFVVPEIRQEIERHELDMSPIEQLATVVSPPIGSEFGTIIDRRGIESGWVGEATSRDETDAPDLGKVTIPIGEIYANPRATQSLLDDAGVDVGSWLTQSIADEFSLQVGAASVSGNGINKPRGFLTYTNVATSDATRAWDQIQYIPTGHATAFLAPTTSVSPADHLFDVVAALKAAYRRNASWVMNSITLATVRKWKDADGKFVVAPGLEQGAPERLMGYPIVTFEDMPAVGANAFPIAFGDWRRAYTLVLRNIRILRDPFTAKPFVQFYTTRRVGGGVTNCQALKLVKVATS
ncbi:MAG: phage major capsid protein [Gemmatimonadales bacterium]